MAALVAVRVAVVPAALLVFEMVTLRWRPQYCQSIEEIWAVQERMAPDLLDCG